MCIRSYSYAILASVFGLIGLAYPTQGQAIKTAAVPARVPTLQLYQAVDARMQQIPDSSARTMAGIARYIKGSFSSETDKARAAFVWVAKNVRYDVDNMYVVSFAGAPTEVAQQALAKRKGVCTGYAELYNAIAREAGLKSYVITGYTKDQGGALAPIGHAWCATRLEGQWYLMDPTWSSGYVVEEAFVPRLSNDYFKVEPAHFIRRHMPFDPLWQFLSKPLTTQQFQQAKAVRGPVRTFNFVDSLAVYERQTDAQRLAAANRRVEQNGVKNALVFNYLGQSYVNAYNEAIYDYNAGIFKLNTFVEFFNHQFLPKKTDAELQQLLPPIAADFAQARALLRAVSSQDASYQKSQKELAQSLQEAETKLQNCQAFMAHYLRTGKLLRPTLFMNVSTIGGRNEMMR
jgi:hypothetical protein